MGKMTYRESNQYQNLKKTIESASKETEAFWNNSELSKEQVDALVQKSNEIMEAMREQCLYVHKNYLAAANSKNYVTLESQSISIKFALPMEKDSEDYVTEYYPIFGNSFGPFNSEEYFLSETKILWLLKESYIEKESWVKNDRGKHKQAEDYYEEDWGTLCSDDGNPTIANVVKLSSVILSFINKNIIPFDKAKKIFNNIKDEKEKCDKWDNWMRGIMNHICIIEVNHFPGLAFASKESNDSETKKWAGINYELIERFIFFYNPKIVIAGGTLEHFLPSDEKGDFSLVKTFIKFDNKSLKIFNDPIIEWMYINAGGRFEDCLPKDMEVERPSLVKKEGFTNVVNASKHPNDTSHMLKFNFGRNAKYLSKNNKRIYIQAYHPSIELNYPLTWAEKDGKRINKWLKGKD